MKKKLLVVVICILTLMIILSSGCIYEKKEEKKESGNGGDVEASKGDIKISNVYHKPENPTVEGDVDYYATVTAVPTGHSVVLVAENYNGNNKTGSYTTGMDKEDNNVYKTGDILSGTGIESGIIVKYKIKIYDVDIEAVDDIEDYTPILESLEHSYTIQ